MTENSPAVLQLQADCIDGSKPVSTLLRTAKLICFKLELADFGRWVDRELGGYFDVADDDLPEYRKLHGRPEGEVPYQGWRPILLQLPDLQELISQAYNRQPAPELEAMMEAHTSGNGGTFSMHYSPHQLEAIYELLQQRMPVRVQVGASRVGSIVEAVRTALLEWSLELERGGVRGEGLVFTPSEKASAATITNHFYDSNIGVLGNVSGRARVGSKQISRSRSG